MFLIQLDDWQAMYAESGGDFATMMDVMFEDMPDDPLEGNCGSHYRGPACCLHPSSAGKFGEGFDHKREVMGENNDVLRTGRNAVWVIAHPGDRGIDGELIALAAG